MGKTEEMSVLEGKPKVVTLSDAVDEGTFLLGDLDFQKFLPTFSGFNFFNMLIVYFENFFVCLFSISVQVHEKRIWIFR